MSVLIASMPQSCGKGLNQLIYVKYSEDFLASNMLAIIAAIIITMLVFTKYTFTVILL